MSIKTSFNPQQYAGGYVSMNRNIFMLSSLAVASIGISKNKDKLDKSVKFIVTILLAYNLLYSFTSTRDFSRYVRHIEKKNELPEMYKFQLKQWNRWIMMGYIYVGVLLAFIYIIQTRF